jgi:hypothetical protein
MVDTMAIVSDVSTVERQIIIVSTFLSLSDMATRLALFENRLSIGIKIEFASQKNAAVR